MKPTFFTEGTVPFGFPQHCARVLQPKFDIRSSGRGSRDRAAVCVHDGFIKGEPSFEKRIPLLAKRKLKCYFPSVGSNERSKELSNSKVKPTENNS